MNTFDLNPTGKPKKLICINNTEFENEFTIGKTYEFNPIGSLGNWLTESDTGGSWTFSILPKDKFITLEDFRENKLKSLGINLK